MSGKENLPITDKLAQIDAVLDEFSVKAGVPPIFDEAKVNEGLRLFGQISIDKLSKLTADELGELAIILSQIVLHIQQASNREFAKHTWLEEELNKYCAKEAPNYGNRYTPYDERKSLVIDGDDYAFRLHSAQRYTKMRMNRLSFIPQRVETLIKTILELQQTRRRNTYGK